jgi:hypothetical protein
MFRAFKTTEVVSTDDGDFTLAIDIEIIDALEDEFDLGFDALMQQFQTEQRVGRLCRLLRGLMARHHPDLSLDDVAGLFMEHADKFGEGFTRLFEKARPDQGEEAKGENPPKPRRGTGGNSSSHGARPASRRATSGSKRPALSS